MKTTYSLIDVIFTILGIVLFVCILFGLPIIFGFITWVFVWSIDWMTHWN